MNAKAVAGAGAAVTTAAGAFTNFISAIQGASGSPEAGTYATMFTLLGIFMLLMGLIKLKPEAMVGGLMFLILAAPLGALLANTLPNGGEGEHPLVESNAPKGLKEAQEAVWKDPKVPKEVEEGGGLEGEYELNKHDIAFGLIKSPWGIQLVVEYTDGSYRLVPKPDELLQSMFMPLHSLLDYDVSGKPKVVKQLRIYIVPRADIHEKNFCYRLFVKFNDRTAYRLEDCPKLPYPISDYHYIWIANLTTEQIEKYVQHNNTKMTVWLYAFVPLGPMGMNQGVSEVSFHVGKGTMPVPQNQSQQGGGDGGYVDLGDLTRSYDKCMETVGGDEIYSDYCRCVVETNNPYSSECTQYLHFIMLSSVFVDQNTGVNLQMVLTLLQIVFYIAVIYDVLRRR